LAVGVYLRFLWRGESKVVGVWGALAGVGVGGCFGAGSPKSPHLNLVSNKHRVSRVRMEFKLAEINYYTDILLEEVKVLLISLSSRPKVGVI